MSELKPCPFCGGEAETVGFDAPERWVICKRCKASTESHTCADAAIEAWNTRAERICKFGFIESDGSLCCSGCGYLFNWPYWQISLMKYCPGCGARMKGGEPWCVPEEGVE